MVARARKPGVSKVVLYKIDPAAELDEALRPYTLKQSGQQDGWTYDVYVQAKGGIRPAWKALVVGMVEDHELPSIAHASLVIVFRHDDDTYALTAGYAYADISPCAVQDFGVDIAKKSLNPNELAQLVQKVPTGNVYGLQRNLRGKYLPANDHMNRKSVLKALRGKCLDQELGLSIEGRTSLSVNGKKDFSDVLRLLDRVRDLEASDQYTVPIRGLDEAPKRLRQVLDDALRKLVDDGNINDVMFGYDDDLVFMRCDTIQVGSSDERFPFDAVTEILEAARRLRPDSPSGARIRGYDDAGIEVLDTQLLRLVEGELDHEGEKYFRISRKWYKTNPDYIAEINTQFDAIDVLDNDYLGAWKRTAHGYEAEDDFLKAQVVPDQRKLAHTRNIAHVEVADLVDTTNHYLIHVKRGRGAFLRNLFAQGYVSASLIQGDAAFRTEAEEKFDLANLQDYKVVLAIFPEDVRATNSIFTLFAKVDLVERCEALRDIGVDVCYTLIR